MEPIQHTSTNEEMQPEIKASLDFSQLLDGAKVEIDTQPMAANDMEDHEMSDEESDAAGLTTADSKRKKQ